VLLVVKINVLPLDTFEFVVLCTKHVHVSYDAGIPKVVESIVDHKMTCTAGVEDGVVSIFDTRAIAVRGGECSCVERGLVDGLIFAFCPLMDYSIID